MGNNIYEKAWYDAVKLLEAKELLLSAYRLNRHQMAAKAHDMMADLKIISAKEIAEKYKIKMSKK